MRKLFFKVFQQLRKNNYSRGGFNFILTPTIFFIGFQKLYFNSVTWFCSALGFTEVIKIVNICY